MRFDQVLLSGASTIKLFDLRNPRSTPYTARTIDGLGPTEVDVTLAQTSQGAGIYIGRREQLREITVNAYLNPNYLQGESPDQLREDIYLLRPVKEDLSLDFRLMFEGVEVATTPVYIKRVDISPFSKDTTLQIVLSSTSGYFHMNSGIELTDPPLSTTTPVFVNEGTSTTGFKLTVQFSDTVDAFGLAMSAPSSKLLLKKLPLDAALFLGGDIVEIDTTIGSRGIWFTRNNVRQSALAALTEDSAWLTLYPGDNYLTVIQDPVAPPKIIWKKLSHTPKYLGV